MKYVNYKMTKLIDVGLEKRDLNFGEKKFFCPTNHPLKPRVG